MELAEPRKEKERDLHDHLRGNWANDPRYNSNKKFYSISQPNQDFVKTWLAERCRGTRVLDFCCGNGGYAIWLAEAGAHAYGIDISSVSVESARKQAGQKDLSARAEFLVMDAEATAFPSNYFDFIVVSGVLHHLDLAKAYGELARILKLEGEIICIEALRHNLLIHFYRKMTPHLRSAWELEHILGKKEIQVARQYFGKVNVAKFFHLATIAAVPFRNLPFFALMRRTLEAVDSVLLHLPLLKWQAWMAVFVLAHPKKTSAH